MKAKLGLAFLLALAIGCSGTESSDDASTTNDTSTDDVLAEITTDDFADPDKILNYYWFIKPELSSGHFYFSLCSLDAEHSDHRITGNQVHHQKHDNRHEKQNRDEINNSTDNILNHFAPVYEGDKPPYDYLQCFSPWAVS